MSPESTFDENRAESEFGIVVARVGRNHVGAGRRGFFMGWGEKRVVDYLILNEKISALIYEKTFRDEIKIF